MFVARMRSDGKTSGTATSRRLASLLAPSASFPVHWFRHNFEFALRISRHGLSVHCERATPKLLGCHAASLLDTVVGVSGFPQILSRVRLSCKYALLGSERVGRSSAAALQVSSSQSHPPLCAPSRVYTGRCFCVRCVQAVPVVCMDS